MSWELADSRRNSQGRIEYALDQGAYLAAWVEPEFAYDLEYGWELVAVVVRETWAGEAWRPAGWQLARSSDLWSYLDSPEFLETWLEGQSREAA